MRLKVHTPVQSFAHFSKLIFLQSGNYGVKAAKLE